jgi:hypothetical protein
MTDPPAELRVVCCQASAVVAGAGVDVVEAVGLAPPLVIVGDVAAVVEVGAVVVANEVVGAAAITPESGRSVTSDPAAFTAT